METEPQWFGLQMGIKNGFNVDHFLFLYCKYINKASKQEAYM